MVTPQHDRNLLVGILAFQMDFISREQLVSAMRLWLLNKQMCVEEVLLSQNVLRHDTFEFLRATVAKHIEEHGGDPKKSLAAINSISSLQDELRCLQDADINESLNRAVAAHVEQDSATISFRPAVSHSSTRFRVLRPHARGGLGQVSVARDEELNREVALKEIQPRFAADPDSRQRFLVEAEVTGRLEHPSIVPVYSLGQFDDGRPFYVMRFIRGDSLKEAIADLHNPAHAGRSDRQWQYELRKLLGRLVDVCNAIEYAHSRGILHRDLKPGNIMLGKYGETLVVDWGVAKALHQTESEGGVSEGHLTPMSGDSSSATLMGSVVGTPSFMSPEQAEGRVDVLGPQTDVYSLGATLYCLLTKQPPIQSGQREETLSKVRRGEFPAPRAVNPRVPRPLEAICLKAMALDQANRYGTPLALAEDLERWLADEPVSVYRDPWIDRGLRAIRRHKSAFVGTTVLVVTVLVGLAINNGVMTRKNSELRAARDRANENMQLAVQEQGRAESNLVTSRKLAVELLNLAENDLSKIKGKELLRQQMTARNAALFRDFYKQKPEDFQLRLELAQVIRIEANITRLMGNTAAAMESYAEAVRLLDGLHDEKSSDTLVLDRLAETLRDQGNALKLQGQLAAAAEAFARARKLAAALIAASPTETNFRRTLATLDVDLADLQMQLGKPEAALQGAHSAVAVFREFTDVGSTNPLDPILLLLASSREGELLLELARPDEAEVVFNDALQRARKRLGVGPEKNTQYLLGRVLTGLAKSRMLRAEPSAPTETMIEEAIAVLQKHVSDFPNTTQYPRYLAAALNTRGELLLGKQDAAGAEMEFERARKTVTSAAAKPEADIADIEALAESVANLGRAALAQKQAAGATKFEEAIGLWSRITERAPDHAIAKRRIRQLKELLQSLTFD